MRSSTMIKGMLLGGFFNVLFAVSGECLLFTVMKWNGFFRDPTTLNFILIEFRFGALLYGPGGIVLGGLLTRLLHPLAKRINNRGFRWDA